MLPLLPGLSLLMERGLGLMQPRPQAVHLILSRLALLLQGDLFALGLFQGLLMLTRLFVGQALGICPGSFQVHDLHGLTSLDLGGSFSDHPLKGFHHAR